MNAGGGRTSRRAGGFGGAGKAAALIQHGVQHVVRSTLLLEINDFVRLQCVNGAGILDVIDNDAVADFGLDELHNLRNSVGKLRRGLARGGGLGAGNLRGHISRRERERGDSGDSPKRIIEISSFHNQDLQIQHLNIVRVARTVNCSKLEFRLQLDGHGLPFWQAEA